MSTTPKRLGKYELLERLGHGGVAEVWKAFDTQLQRFVAIKLLHPDLRDDPNFVERFRREAQLIASLHHPNIVQIHDFQVYQPDEEQKEEGTPIAYMVMDYVEGQTLANYIHNTSSKVTFPSPEEIVNLFTSISLAIDYAHKKGMIHRDIKPANILLDQRNTGHNPMGEPILTDFGVARMLSATSNTLSGTLLGTPLYISPEQAKGYPGNERSDLYSLGVILYEMVTGTPPFRGDTALEVISQHVHAVPTAPALINPAIPPALSAVLQRSLSKDPSARFPSAAALTVAIADAFQLPVPESLAHATSSPDMNETPTLFQELPANNTPIQSGPSSQPGISRPISQPGFAGTPSQPGFSNPSSQPGISRPISQPGFPNPSSQPGFARSISQPGIANPPSQPGFSGPISQPGFSGPISQPGLSTPSQPGFTPIMVHPTPTAAAPITAPPPPKKTRPLWPYLVLVGVVLLAVIGAGIGAALYLPGFKRQGAAPNPVVGRAFYLSSGQITPTSAQGIADQLQLDLQDIPSPAAGNSYSLWLLGDKTPEPGADLLGGISTRPVKPPILLTDNLPLVNGTIHYHYNGDAQHNNLISATSRLLITEGPSGETRSQAG